MIASLQVVGSKRKAAIRALREYDGDIVKVIQKLERDIQERAAAARRDEETDEDDDE